MKAFVLVFGLLFCAACEGDKPTEQECERVVAHIRQVNGNQHAEVGADTKSMVRSCRARSTKATAQCMLAAKTPDELNKCGNTPGKP